jgi:hypothetical protein
MERITGTLTYSFLLKRKAQREKEEQECKQMEAEKQEEARHRDLLTHLRRHHAENCVRVLTLCTNSKVSMAKCIRKTKRH